MRRWFGPRPYGYGVAPCSWQGWLATAVLIAVLLGSRFIRWEALGLPHWSRAVFIPLATLAYLGLVMATYQGD